MKRTEYRTAMEAYNIYAQTVNPRVVPTPGTSTGTWGRDFETRVKCLLKNNRSAVVSGKIGTDTVKYGYHYEIKHRCGSFGTYDPEADIMDFSALLQNDFIIYSMDYRPTWTDADIMEQARIVPTWDFLDFLESENLIKKNAQRRNLQIQVFYTSQKRTARFAEFLEQYPQLYTLVSEINGRERARRNSKREEA